MAGQHGGLLCRPYSKGNEKECPFFDDYTLMKTYFWWFFFPISAVLWIQIPLNPTQWTLMAIFRLHAAPQSDQKALFNNSQRLVNRLSVCKIVGVPLSLKKSHSISQIKGVNQHTTVQPAALVRVQSMWNSVKIDISPHLWSAKPPCHVNIKSSKSQWTAASPPLHSWLLGHMEKIIWKLQQMMQQSSYIIHGELSGWQMGGKVQLLKSQTLD